MVVPVGGPFYIVSGSDLGLPANTNNNINNNNNNSSNSNSLLKYAIISYHDECHYNALVPRGPILDSIRLLNRLSGGGGERERKIDPGEIPTPIHLVIIYI